MKKLFNIIPKEFLILFGILIILSLLNQCSSNRKHYNEKPQIETTYHIWLL